MGHPPRNTLPLNSARPIEAEVGVQALSNLTKVAKVARKLRSTAKIVRPRENVKIGQLRCARS